MTEERFLVTGALGCVGAWTVRELVREGTPVVGFDLGSNDRRLTQILDPGDRELDVAAWGMMGANVFLGLRFAVWDDAEGEHIAEVMSRVWRQGFGA